LCLVSAVVTLFFKIFDHPIFGHVDSKRVFWTGLLALGIGMAFFFTKGCTANEKFVYCGWILWLWLSQVVAVSGFYSGIALNIFGIIIVSNSLYLALKEQKSGGGLK